VFGIIIILLICLVPFFKIKLYSVSIQIITALVQPVADKRMIRSLGCLYDGTKLLARVIISTGFLFIISIAIICMTTNIS
jgi:stage III sporulation protein AE